MTRCSCKTSSIIPNFICLEFCRLGFLWNLLIKFDNLKTIRYELETIMTRGSCKTRALSACSALVEIWVLMENYPEFSRAFKIIKLFISIWQRYRSLRIYVNTCIYIYIKPMDAFFWVASLWCYYSYLIEILVENKRKNENLQLGFTLIMEKIT